MNADDTRSLPLSVFEALNGQIILYADCAVVRHNRSYTPEILKHAEPVEYTVPLDTIAIAEVTPSTGYRRLIVRIAKNETISLTFRHEDLHAAHRLIDTLKDLRRTHSATSAV